MNYIQIYVKLIGNGTFQKTVKFDWYSQYVKTTKEHYSKRVVRQ